MAEARSAQVYEAIFEAELDDWHRDTGTWPAERTYAVFRKWFDVRLYTLIQDLVGEVVGKELTTTQPDEQCIGERRTALEGVQPLQRAEKGRKSAGPQSGAMT